jgi:antitoxin (DNA-binding transcriptional repressor) of toxin-antitoxin stability system
MSTVTGTNAVTNTVTVSEARATLPMLLERVQAGEEITLTRHGQAVAVIVRPDTLRARRADGVLAAAARLHDLFEAGRRLPLPVLPPLDEERAAALLAVVRSSRSQR